MKNGILWLFLALAPLAACSENLTPPAEGDGGESRQDESEGEPGQAGAGGSTSAGNPVQSLTFDLQGAVGLAIDNSAGASALALTDEGSSNLKRVNLDNSLSDAVSSGSATVKNLMVAAGNQVYLLLASPVDSCILLRVEAETNAVSCVDSSITNLVWHKNASFLHDPIQFDGSGAIYYLFTDSKGRLVLRRNAAGVVTDLINDSISVKDFLVVTDGTVFLTGETTPTGSKWVRTLSPANSIQNIFTSATANFMSLFPDGNIYMGIWAVPVFGVARYLVEEALLEETKWITTDINGLTEPRYFDCRQISTDGTSPQADFTGWCGSYVTAIHRTTDSKVYVVAGDSAEGVLMQYYPEVREAKTSVVQVSISKGILTSLILAGLDRGATNRLVLFDTRTESETNLLGPENIEVYHLSYRNANNHQLVLFDGLRFSDGQYVICQVDLTNNQAIVCSKTGTTRLADFQIFEE